MGIKVIHHQHQLFCLWINVIDQILHKVREVGFRAPLFDTGDGLAGERFTRQKKSQNPSRSYS